MRFPILREPKLGLDCLRIDIPLQVFDQTKWPRNSPFILDTGSEVSMVSEDVAALLNFPGGGRATSITAVITGGAGRSVPVRFRFAGVPDVEIDSEWVVVGGRAEVRLLALRDILPHFEVRTLNMNLYFSRK
jgi:hypothetical protein